MSRRKRMIESLDADTREHIAQRTQENIDRGMAPDEARYAALRKFGNLTRVREDTREVWSFVWLEELLQDIRLRRPQPRQESGIHGGCFAFIDARHRRQHHHLHAREGGLS